MKTKVPGMLILLLASLGLLAQTTRTLPEGTTIKVRTDTVIPAKPPSGATYGAVVSEDVMDANGQVAIPRGAKARLVASPTTDGKDTNLDLRSVTLNGRRYNIEVANSNSSAPGGLGANKKTAKYVGGGAAIGAVLGAILGGGKGAALGAILGGGAGAGTQVYEGRKKEIPAETVLSFKTAQALEVRPASTSSHSGLQHRPASQ
jgi:hypothetical protein